MVFYGYTYKGVETNIMETMYLTKLRGFNKKKSFMNNSQITPGLW